MTDDDIPALASAIVRTVADTARWTGLCGLAAREAMREPGRKVWTPDQGNTGPRFPPLEPDDPDPGQPWRPE